MAEPGRRLDYLCICLLDWEPGDFQKIHLCIGHSRSQQCYRCTSGTLLSSDCSFQPRWGRCCHCIDKGGKASQGRVYPEGLRSSHHHRAHTFYLHVGQSDVRKERPQTYLALLDTHGLVTKSPGEPSDGRPRATADRAPAQEGRGPGLQSWHCARPAQGLGAQPHFVIRTIAPVLPTAFQLS